MTVGMEPRPRPRNNWMVKTWLTPYTYNTNAILLKNIEIISKTTSTTNIPVIQNVSFEAFCSSANKTFFLLK